ncbi:hypothetical protein BV898_09643 [Hypsibius exemplaris]|uniref:Putative auto-transporter adhesin head GIN domain-containing protein n=1 Tax=Hypsibius exemplaris TaxID=2072580 RepID=A0A1W0WLT8_HYPEX|nr:hypothetical protein BV898_09643 [Hypsibius exemplaris]
MIFASAFVLSVLILHSVVAVTDFRDFDGHVDYESVLVFGGLSIVVEYGEGVSVEAPSPASIQTTIDQDKQLIIRPIGLSAAQRREKVHITVRFSRVVSWPSIRVNDGSTVLVFTGQRLSEIEFISNSSHIMGSIVVDDVISRMYGSGIITLNGQAVQSFVGVFGGSGLHNAVNLRASERVEIYIKGAGILSMWTGYTAGFIDGSGVIRYRDLETHYPVTENPPVVLNSTRVYTNGDFRIYRYEEPGHGTGCCRQSRDFCGAADALRVACPSLRRPWIHPCPTCAPVLANFVYTCESSQEPTLLSNCRDGVLDGCFSCPADKNDVCGVQDALLAHHVGVEYGRDPEYLEVLNEPQSGALRGHKKLCSFVRDFGGNNNYESALVFEVLPVIVEYGVGVTVIAPTVGSVETIISNGQLTIRPVNLSAEQSRDDVHITVRFNASIAFPKVLVNDGSAFRVSAERLTQIEFVANNSSYLIATVSTSDVISVSRVPASSP